ncbi:MAG TPA: ankyrin repeat domain-containing protein [Pyrinomonadaceae bacterium]
MFSTDTILQHRYRVIRPLGRGGMGAVYEAFDERLSRTVALKETLAETDELRRAFGREARLLANLRHPALPKVLDHFDEGSGLFLVMEFIPGDDLGRLLELGRTFDPAEVLGWAGQLLDALDYLHGLDPPVLHRDIKPSNLKLLPTGHVILLDFGLAKGSAGQMTGTGATSLLGYSPAYSPLEQMQGTGTDVRSDLYSLGATLYHLLTGVRPPDALSRATAVVNGQPDPLQPPHHIRPEVPASVSAALMRAVALDTRGRPRTASEMRAQLHDTAPRAADTVAMAGGEEVTRVSVAASRAVTTAATSEPFHRPGPRVVVPVSEETRVANRRGGGGKKLIVGATLLAALVVFSAVLYMFIPASNTTSVTQTNRPTVSNSPSPTPSPTPTENINRQENVNSTPVVSPDELAARERLAQRNIPYSEDAFTKAVEEGDIGAVDLLLAAGMSPDVKDESGRTALISAASRGRNHVSQKLLSRGADVNARDANGSTALMQSALGGHKETTDVLLGSNADVNLRDNNGQTALIRAAARGHADIVRSLLNRGARTDVKDRSGRDALTWAKVNNKSDVVDLLKKH